MLVGPADAVAVNARRAAQERAEILVMDMVFLLAGSKRGARKRQEDTLCSMTLGK
jgi:hypothetical protein